MKPWTRIRSVRFAPRRRHAAKPPPSCAPCRAAARESAGAGRNRESRAPDRRRHALFHQIPGAACPAGGEFQLLGQWPRERPLRDTRNFPAPITPGRAVARMVARDVRDLGTSGLVEILRAISERGSRLPSSSHDDWPRAAGGAEVFPRVFPSRVFPSRGNEPESTSTENTKRAGGRLDELRVTLGSAPVPGRSSGPTPSVRLVGLKGMWWREKDLEAYVLA